MSSSNPFAILAPDEPTPGPVSRANARGNAGRDSKRHEPYKPEHGRQYDRQSGTGRGTEVRKDGFGKGGPGRNDVREQFKGEAEARRGAREDRRPRDGERGPRGDRGERGERRGAPRDPAREEQRKAWEARRQEREAERKEQLAKEQEALAAAQAGFQAATLDDIPFEEAAARVEISRQEKVLDRDLLDLAQKPGERRQRARKNVRQELQV